MSSICQVRDSTRIDSFAAKARPRVRSASASETIVGDRRHDLHARDEMGELGEIGEHHRRIGAGVVLVAQFASSAAAMSPRISASNRSMMRVRSARPSICRTSSARTGAGRMRDRLIEQRERVAHRAFGGARDQRQRLRLDRDAFLGGRCLRDA